MFEKNFFFGARFFKNLQKLSMGTPIVSCRHPPGFGSLFWRFFTIFHGFSLGKMFFQALRTYIDAKFHGESISDGFRAIRDRKVGQKLKKKIVKLDFPVTLLQNLSRSSPDATVVIVSAVTYQPTEFSSHTRTQIKRYV